MIKLCPDCKHFEKSKSKLGLDPCFMYPGLRKYLNEYGDCPHFRFKWYLFWKRFFEKEF